MQNLVSTHLSRVSAMFIASFLALWTFSGCAFASESLLKSVEIHEDTSSELTIDKVQDSVFHPSRNSISEGYTGSVYWFRLHIRSDRDGDDVALIVRPSTLDMITLYTPDPATEGGWQEYQAGGRMAAPQQGWVSSLRDFRLKPSSEGTVYYLRVESVGSVSITIDAMSPFSAYRLGLLIDFGQITYMSVMLVLALWSLRMALLTKEELFWWFALLQATWVLHNAFYFGYVTVVFPLLQQDWVFVTYRAVVIAASIISIAFHKKVLLRFSPHPAALKLFDLLLIFMGAAFVLYWFVDSRDALTLNAFCIAASPFVFLINAFTAQKTAPPGLITMKVIYSLLSGALLLWVLSLVGAYSVGTLSLYGPVIHGSATGLLMFTILHLHGRHLIAEIQSARAELTLMQERQSVEREQNRLLGRLMDMLAHETKNAMAVINMSVSAPNFGARQKLRIGDSISALTAVVDRCNQAVMLDSKGHVIRKEDCDLVALLHDLRTTSADAQRIDLQVPSIVQIKTDPLLLSVILSNLIENAIKYSERKSMITIKLLFSEKPNVLIWVENDEGPAGAPDKERVFQKFYRHHRAQSNIGSGLGLYLVQGLARLLGGDITYEPEGSRIRFRLSLPC